MIGKAKYVPNGGGGGRFSGLEDGGCFVKKTPISEAQDKDDDAADTQEADDGRFFTVESE
jgi:hypothetical protein